MKRKLSGIEKELVIRKMKKISEQVKQGKIKVLSEEEVKKKYDFK